MATKINAGDDMKRGDFFFVDPYQVIVKDELRGRHTPPTEQQIVDMAMSMSDNGQRQAVECRKIENDKLLLNLGFTRTAAARLLREGFTVEGKEYKDAEFKLKVVLSDANDEQAFKNNIVENAHRNATSPMDDAYNQHRLRDKYGMADDEIGKLYRYTDPNKVDRYRKLLSLEKVFQDQVHSGELPVDGAIQLLELPAASREAAVKAATNAKTGKVVATQVRAQVREHHLSDDNNPNAGGSTGTGKAKNLTRSMREVRAFFQAIVDDESSNERDTEFAKTFLAYMAGKRTDKYLTEAFHTHRTGRKA
jgi:ParB-like chromosome segregation protein Spo0J